MSAGCLAGGECLIFQLRHKPPLKFFVMDKIAIEFDIGIGRRIKMVLAIIDLGSNSIRMDIVEIDEKTGSHRYIERCRDMRG